MRQHFRKHGLCSHTTPNGTSIVGEEEKLRKKFEAGTITKEELWSYCLFAHAHKKTSFTVNGEVSFDVPKTENTFKTIRVWGKEIQVSIEEHQIHCAHLDF